MTEFMTPADAAETLKIGQSTLAKLRMTHSGPRFRKFGRTVRYERGELLEWASNQTHQCTVDYALL